MRIDDLEVLGSSIADLGILVRMTGLSFREVAAAIEEAAEKGYLAPGPLPDQWLLTAPKGGREQRRG